MPSLYQGGEGYHPQERSSQGHLENLPGYGVRHDAKDTQSKLGNIWESERLGDKL